MVKRADTGSSREGTTDPEAPLVLTFMFADIRGWTRFTRERGQLLTHVYGTRAYDAVTGAVSWTKTYDGSGNGWGHAEGIAGSLDGSTVFITGGSNGAGSADDIATVAYGSTDCQVLWSDCFGGTSRTDDEGVDIEMDPNGSRLFLAGYGYSAATLLDFVAIAYEV